MLELKTNQLKTRKKVLIDGHEYTVRKLGNIEQLDLSQYMRRLDTLAKIEATQPLNDKQLQQVQDISDRIAKLFISLFDDGGDQTKSRALVASLNEAELTIMLSQIFDEDNNEPVAS